MRLLYLTQTFPPEPGPTLRPMEQARCLARHGHRVRVLTTFPYYPTGLLNAEDRVLRRHEKTDDFELLRVASVTAANRGAWRRMASFGSFSAHAALAGLGGPPPDVVIASVPNPGTEAAGLFLARSFGVPFVLELRDLLPESIQLAGFARVSSLYRVAERWYRAVYRRADAIVVPQAGMVDILADLAGIDRRRLLFVPHGADPERFRAADGGAIRRRLGIEHKFVVAYSGSFSRYYGIRRLIESAAHVLPASRIHWMLIGAGPERSAVSDFIREADLSNVTLVDAVSPTRIADWLAAADVCISPILTRGALSYAPERLTKLCDYLAMGKPILAIEDEPVSGPFLEEIGAGYAVPWDSPDAIAAAVERLASNCEMRARFSAAARRFAERELPRERTMQPLLQWLESRTVSNDALTPAGAADGDESAPAIG